MHYAAIARTSLNRAASLTQRMLAFARRQSLQPSNVEPDKLLRGMEEFIRHSVGAEIEVRMRPHDGVWSVLCDPNQLESALLNLAINARDAMPDGGALTISTTDRSLTQADLLNQDEVQPGQYVEFAVADTGTGMTPDVLVRVFEPFFTTKPTGQGTGLGLSQVFGFVRQSGGFVRLESELGRGTTVRIFLPRHDRANGDDAGSQCSRSAATTADFASAETITGTVLVVEDEADVRSMIADVLRDLGCKVIEARDGNTRMNIVRSQDKINMLITDVGLPSLNGRQLAEAAREARPLLPVLLITGYAGKTLEDAELPPGMEVMRKPFALETLSERIRALLKFSSSGEDSIG